MKMKPEMTVILRSEGAEAVAQMSKRSSSVLLAECELQLESHLRHCGCVHVRRVAEISRSEAEHAAHFTAHIEGAAALVYVLSVWGMAAPSALSAAQAQYAAAQTGYDVYVLPCLVQHTGAERSRCVALPLVAVRRKDAWLAEAEVAQYLPVSLRTSLQQPMPCGAWYLKRRNLVREVANHGQLIYPLVRGFAHARHLPEGVEMRGSGTESPLMLVLTEGRAAGRIQLSYGDFYAAENAVNELVVKAVCDEGVAPLVQLIADDGREYRAICAELRMFPEHMWEGRRFMWSLNMLCNHVTMLGKEEFPVAEVCDNSLYAVVESVGRSSFCGLPLCHIVARSGSQLVNVYAAVYDAEAPLPEPGERFCASGTLYAAPDALVKKAPQIIPVEFEETPSDEVVSAAVQPAADMMPYSLSLAVVAGALSAAGYERIADFKPLFRNGLPEFRVRRAGGRQMLVFVDCIVNQLPDKRGYMRYAPDCYPTFVDRVSPENQPADVLFVTVKLVADGDGYRVTLEQHGADVPGLKACEYISCTEAGELDELQAVRVFGEMMFTHNFTAILPLLREDVLYESETAGLSFGSKMDLLRHFRSCFDNWRRRDELKNLKFLLSSVCVGEVRRPCVLACQHSEIISATILDVKEGRITSIRSLAGDVLDTLKPIE